MIPKRHGAANLHYFRISMKVLLGVLLTVLLGYSTVFAQQDQTRQAVSKEQQERLDQMKSKGVEGSLTILPVRLFGDPEVRVSEVVGVILEQEGLKNIELGQMAYTPPEKAKLPDLAEALGKFVKETPVPTEYVLYAEMSGDKQKHSINELVGVVVDKSGAVVWSVRKDSKDEQFRLVEDRDPAGFSILLVQLLSPQMGLNEETAKNAKPGKMAAIMSERSGLPPDEERAVLPERQRKMKENFKSSTLTVFPVRVNGEADSKPEAHLVSMINDAGLCKGAAPSKENLLVKSSREGPNEMKKLWDMAREFRDYVRKNPQDADYLLYADYFMPGYVHFVVCDRSGEWVIADLQNSAHPDFRTIDPSKAEGCDKLVLIRLQKYLKTSVTDVVRETINKSGIEAGDAKFRELRANMAGFFLSEEEMNALGYEYLWSKRIKEAIAVFRMNTEAFPESFNTYDSLGEAYAAAGEKDLAIQNYEKSVQLNPKSQSGIEALKKLKGK